MARNRQRGLFRNALALLACAACWSTHVAALAQTYTWSGGTTGTWDTTATNWIDATGTPWNAANGASSTAAFTAASTATVSGTVYANELATTAATTVSGGTAGGRLSLTGAAPALRSDGLLTISAVVIGTGGLTKTGTNGTILSGSNTYTGTTFLDESYLRADNASALGNNGTITFRGGSLRYAAASAGTDWATRFRSSASPIILDTNGVDVTLSGSIASSNSGGLVKWGGGTLTLAGSNAYTGLTSVTRGVLAVRTPRSLYGGGTASWTAANINVQGGAVLAVGVGGTAGFTPANITTLLTNLASSADATNGMNAGSSIGFDTTNTGTTYTYSGVIADTTGAAGGARGFAKLGSGTLVLTATQAYTGQTGVGGGVLRLGSTNQVSAASQLAFRGNGTLDIGATTQTFSGLTTVAAGTFTGMAVTGSGGTLIVTGGTAAVEVGPGGSIGGGWSEQLTLAGLDRFEFDNASGVVRVGPKPGSTRSGTPGTQRLTLAKDNAIRTQMLAVGDQGLNDQAGTSQLYLGPSNVLNVGTIDQGFVRSNSAIQFASGTTNSVVIRGVDGTSPVTSWTIGTHGHWSSTFTSTVDLSGGTVDAEVTDLVLGVVNARSNTGDNGTQNSTFTMGSGTLSATSITLGRLNGSASSVGATRYNARGTLTIGRAGAVVDAGNIVFAENNYYGSGTGTNTTQGTVNLSAGTLRAQSLALGPQSGASSVVATAVVTVTGGTIANRPAFDLSVTGVPIALTSGTGTFAAEEFRSITLDAASPLSGTGTLVKTGLGTLTVQSAGTFAGPIRVAEGTLAIGSGGSLATTPLVNVAAGATFDTSAAPGYTFAAGQVLAGGGGLVGGPTVGSGATIMPEAGTAGLTATAGGVGLAGGGSYNVQLLDAAGGEGTGWGLVTTDAVALSGVTAAEPFTVNLWSLSAANPATTGLLANFDSTQLGFWRILTSESSITGFDPAAFVVSTQSTASSGGFLNPLFGGSFSVALSPDTLGLDLVFVPAELQTWYGNGAVAGGSGTWSSAAPRWYNSSLSSVTPWVAANAGLFDAVGGTVTVSGNQIANNGLTFTVTDYTLTGGTLTLGGTTQGANTLTVTTGSATIASPITAAAGLAKSGTGTLALTGNVAVAGGVRIDLGTLSVGAGGTTGAIAGNASVAARTTLAFNRSDAITYSGTISGPGSVNVLGSSVTLTGSNTYTGGSIISGGTLAVGAGGTAGSIAGNVVTNGTLVFNRSDAQTFAGAISGTGGVVKQAANTLVLSGSSTYSGATLVNAGMLQPGAANRLSPNSRYTFAGGSTLDVKGFSQSVGGLSGSGPVINTGSTAATLSIGEGTYSGQISGSISITKRVWPGTLTLSGSNSFTGGVGISQPGTGTLPTVPSILRIANSHALGSGTKTLTATGYGWSIELDGSAGAVVIPESIRYTLSNSGGADNGNVAAPGIRNVAGNNTLAGTIGVTAGGGGLKIQSDAGSLTLSGSISAVTSGRLLELAANGGSITVGGTIANGLGLSVTKTGTGTVYYTRTNTYAGLTTMTAGRLDIAANQSIGGIVWTGGSITGSGTVTINYGGGTGVALANASGTFTQDIVLASGSGSNNLDFGAAADLTLTLAGNISETGGSRGFDVYSNPGTGTVALTGSNSFTGLIYVHTGKLLVGGPNAVPNVDVTVRSGQQLLVNGFSPAIRSLTLNGTGPADGILNNNSATPVALAPTNGTTLTANSSIGGSGNITLNNAISGAGFGLTKVGAGRLTLTGTGSYTGATTVSGGTLTIGPGGSVNSASLLSVASGATVNFSQNSYNAFGATQQSGTWSIAGTLRATTAQANTVVANVALTSGTIDSTGGAPANYGAFYVNGKTITANGVGNVISGNGRVGIDGTVTLATPLVGDALSVSAQLGSGGANANGGRITKTGLGTVVFEGANTYTGSTTIQGGVLRLANGAALASSPVVPLAGGTLAVADFLQTTVGGLAANAGGLTDVGSGFITVAGGLSTADMLAALLSGRGDGSWSGTSGITSSVAQAAVAAGDLRTVGWLDNGDGSVVFAFAAPGDTNLDWSTDILDVSNFVALGKFNTGQASTWSEGDFSYDGIVDILDAADFFATGLYNAGVYNPPPGSAGITAVPEPAGAAGIAVALGGGMLLALRRRATRVSP